MSHPGWAMFDEEGGMLQGEGGMPHQASFEGHEGLEMCREHSVEARERGVMPHEPGGERQERWAASGWGWGDAGRVFVEPRRSFIASGDAGAESGTGAGETVRFGMRLGYARNVS